MDIIAKRFPHLAVSIANNLDDQSIVKFRKANGKNSEFQKQNRLYWIRILKKYKNSYFETSSESWKKAIARTPVEFVRKLAMAALNFFKTASEDIKDFIEVNFHPWNKEQLTPLHIAAYDGDLHFFLEVKKITFTINHRDQADRDLTTREILVGPRQWWVESAPPDWNRVKVSENLGATSVVPVAPH